VNILAGVAPVAINAVLAQTDHTRPSKRCALTHSSSRTGRRDRDRLCRSYRDGAADQARRKLASIRRDARD
jgi:hypothetical protein